MKFGFRIPNLNKRIAARTSWKRVVRNNLGFKAPRGIGWFTDPKKTLYNRIYNRTTTGCMAVIPFLRGGLTMFLLLINLVFRHAVFR